MWPGIFGLLKIHSFFWLFFAQDRRRTALLAYALGSVPGYALSRREQVPGCENRTRNVPSSRLVPGEIEGPEFVDTARRTDISGIDLIASTDNIKTTGQPGLNRSVEH